MMDDALMHSLILKIRESGYNLYNHFGSLLGQKRVLSIIYKNEGMLQSELQKILKVKAGTLSEMLRKLEDKHLIHRDQDPLDKRFVKVMLTDDGEHQARIYVAEYHDMMQEKFSNLSIEEMTVLFDLLNKLDL